MFRSGQHFLMNQSAIKKIAEALDMKKDDVVIEIGAGHGELTGELVNWLIGKGRKGRIILIEKDGVLAESLREKYREDKKIEIINGDVLKILPTLISESANQLISYKLIGNIPYYITGKLLRLISELEHKPSRCVFTVQREVAERICAQPKEMNRAHNGVMCSMNRLAASVQFWAKPEIIEYISRNDFEPKPEVDSAIVTLTLIDTDNKLINADKYYQAVRILFRQPRKTILNNLAEGVPKTPKNLIAQELEKIGIDPNARPQNLSIEDIIRIAGIVE